MDSSLFIGPIGPLVEKGLAPEKQVPEPEFPVPVISELERGKYYLQLGSYSRSDLVKNALAKIDKSYPLAVQTQGKPGEPVYLLLVGPVNQGESGALLQRFKRSGFGDAFVKSN
jgi:cell division septation protein DedD